MDLIDIRIAYNLSKYDVIALCVGGNCLESFRDCLKLSHDQIIHDLQIVMNEACAILLNVTVEKNFSPVSNKYSSVCFS